MIFFTHKAQHRDISHIVICHMDICLKVNCHMDINYVTCVEDMSSNPAELALLSRLQQ